MLNSPDDLLVISDEILGKVDKIVTIIFHGIEDSSVSALHDSIEGADWPSCEEMDTQLKSYQHALNIIYSEKRDFTFVLPAKRIIELCVRILNVDGSNLVFWHI